MVDIKRNCDVKQMTVKQWNNNLFIYAHQEVEFSCVMTKIFSYLAPASFHLEAVLSRFINGYSSNFQQEIISQLNKMVDLCDPLELNYNNA